MGRGNFCPVGKLTEQWYIDNDLYRYEDEDGEDFIDYDFMMMEIDYALELIQKRFPSFYEHGEWVDSYWGQKAVLVNGFFEIGIADNEWSEAIYIRERDDLDERQMGLAKSCFPAFRQGIENILLDMFGTIYLRNGPWMSTRLEKKMEVTA